MLRGLTKALAPNFCTRGEQPISVVSRMAKCFSLVSLSPSVWKMPHQATENRPQAGWQQEFHD